MTWKKFRRRHPTVERERLDDHLVHVTAERPQNHIAIAASPVTSPPARYPSAVVSIAITAGVS